MESSSSSDEKEKLLLLSNHSPNPKLGGIRTIPFIIVNESFERLASIGLSPNMVFYLMYDYNLELATAQIVLSLWSALSNGLAIVGAGIADSCLGRFRVIALGSISSFLGMTTLWLTAMIPQLKPVFCDQSNYYSCSSPSIGPYVILFTAFGLISIGAGCIRPCSMAFGADQLGNKDNPNNKRVLASYINWYNVSTAFSAVLALTVVVYIQENFGYKVGFAIPAILMLFSALIFYLGSFLYIKVKASKSLFSGFVQVLLVAFKNRNISLPPNLSDDCYYQGHESKLLGPTDNLRCLNKACIITNPERDLNSDGSASDPWSLCTVEQVESLKSLLHVMPMWSTGVMLTVSITQNSFATLQAKTMNRHLISNFEVPAGSFSVFMVVALMLWIGLYEWAVVPFLAKYTGNSRGIGPKVRMGISFIVACIATAIGAFTETVRREMAIKQGVQDDPNATVDMSAMWLVPQYALLGAADAFNSSGQIEFYYTRFSKSMSSIAIAIYTLGMGASSLVGSVLVDTVDNVTSSGGKTSWLASNINKGHIDYYYWLITFMGLVNFVYFLICCRVFYNEPSKDENERTAFSDEGR